MTGSNAFFDQIAQLFHGDTDGACQAMLDKFDELRVYQVTWNLGVAEHPPVFSVAASSAAEGAVVLQKEPDVRDGEVHTWGETIYAVYGVVLPVCKFQEARIGSESLVFRSGR
ncbi:hypothetical protein [Nocardia gamkensis]|uniref:Uncharacterized protein n=1 Tax=Nocardia gamkensis TaxID=352869 RepID=A0A7X6R6P1_9NOCA|nr:hypothetical protein [Nocardia gamkensis]NKY30759.1 hypothetical protein [Nocardia gamkensis]